MSAIGRILGWHEDPAVIGWWRKRLGWMLRSLTPARRRLMLATASIVIGARHFSRLIAYPEGLPVPTSALGSCIAIVAVFGLLGLLYAGAARFQFLPAFVRRHPQVALHLTFWGLLFLLWNTGSDAGDWRRVAIGFTLIVSTLLWRIGYLLLSAQRGRAAGTRFSDHLIYLLPRYPGYIAQGKGLDYLARHEAQDEDALARSQLAGIKLLLLAALWKTVRSALNGLVYGDPGGVWHAFGGVSGATLPRFAQLLAQGEGALLWQSWASIYFELVREVLETAAYGHTIIGVLRLFGFNVFRSTYKPLLAETIVAFWGRFDYYFKEVLVDFFFLPVFASCFRKHPGLRMFAAVFAAAFIGNMYVHLLAVEPRAILFLGDFEALWAALHSRVFYSLLLTIGIFVSMRREQRSGGRRPIPGMVRRIARLAGVWTFFAVIRIWDHHPEVPFLTRTQFFLSLFGIA